MLGKYGPLLGFSALFLTACSHSSTPDSPTDGGADLDGAEADGPLPAQSDACAGACPQSNVKHVVIIVQENHTFDNHFGRYCTATPGSNPTCTAGPSCCEAMPATDPAGNAPVTLTDAVLATWDPDHTNACESSEMDDGKMDKYVSATCGNAGNVAVADPTIIKPYWDYAAAGALADRYFQPVVGQSSSNDMYLARAQFVFLDNSAGAKGAIGLQCALDGPAEQYTGPTIGDLLTQASVPWTWFSDGYAVMQQAVAAGTCPPAPADCPLGIAFYPCTFDPGDVPFDYYASTVDNPATLKDLSAFYTALESGGLPAVSFVKGIGYKSEHPGAADTLSAGVSWVTDVVSKIERSPYASDTLTLLTYDEGGGYFDHVTPPPTSTVDNQPYGTRIPLVAIGPFAKKNYVSHVVMEHSSLVKFIEWNWLGGKTGQLRGRDVAIANIGDLLDPAATGVQVPAN